MFELTFSFANKSWLVTDKPSAVPACFCTLHELSQCIFITWELKIGQGITDVLCYPQNITCTSLQSPLTWHMTN